MRNMSFMLTPQQIKAQTKTVTRRLGWRDLKPGTLLRAVRKCQGLKKGETIDRLGVLRVVDVRREPLRALTDDLDYGFAEVEREGLADHPRVRGYPSSFVEFFCGSHRGCTPESTVTRIEFEYVSLDDPIIRALADGHS